MRSGLMVFQFNETANGIRADTNALRLKFQGKTCDKICEVGCRARYSHSACVAIGPGCIGR
jgi:hypothetical protein